MIKHFSIYLLIFFCNYSHSQESISPCVINHEGDTIFYEKVSMVTNVTCTDSNKLKTKYLKKEFPEVITGNPEKNKYFTHWIRFGYGIGKKEVDFTKGKMYVKVYAKNDTCAILYHAPQNRYFLVKNNIIQKGWFHKNMVEFAKENFSYCPGIMKAISNQENKTYKGSDRPIMFYLEMVTANFDCNFK